MATLAEHPVVAPSTYDQDIDTFLNLDQLTYTTSEPARPKAALAQPSIPPTEFNAGDLRSANFAATGQSPIAFQGPSHQYDEHKQQTGLPPGALAQAMTFNQMNGMGYGGASPGYMMNADMFTGTHLKREDASLDFNTIPSRNPSEMDLESDNMGAVPGYFFSPNPNKSQFVDPSAIGGQEVVPAGPSTQVGRMYPGMHQQQAAMAKAAQQQKHHEMMRQQQQLQQQRRMEEQMQHNGNPQAQPPRNTNPIVEERITRLLQQMRQSSTSSSPSDSPSPSGLPQMAKAKKDEQDMDEDERLLASEEGKKLSSKERRQLRNKVSARAFRSRRKEYIGQLESEVAARTNEAHELRLQNRALYEENARLTDLARMLLSSPNFSQFLDEMPMNGVPTSAQPQPPQQQQPQQLQSQPQPQQQQPTMQANVPKDTNHGHGPQEFAMQQNAQVGMVVVPNQGLDVAAMGMNNAGWNSGIDMNYNPSVFAVLEVPEPSIIDTEILSGKSSSAGTYLPEITDTKNEIPVLERMPMSEEPKEASFGVENPDVEFDESDPAFALFADSPATSQQESLNNSFNGVELEKSAHAFELVVETESQDAETRFSYLCHSMDAAFQLMLITRRGSSNYLLYNSTTHKLSGFDFLPTPPVGQKPMKFFYQVVTTPTADTPGTTVLLQFPEKRYFFGQISEGTQRACTERGVKIAYLTDVFLTGRMEWGNNGGLIGVILTLADGVASANTAQEAMAREKEARQQKSGKSAKQSPAKKLEHGVPYAVKDGEAVAQRGTLTIHGGKNLAHTLATARRFVFRKGMPVFTREYDCEGMAKRGSAEAEDPFEQPTWSDDNIKVWAMPIRPLTSLQPKDVPHVAPQSPRKRSLDEFREEVTTQEAIDPRTRDQIIRQSVITDMFNSTWKLDALVETPLAEVKMPAVMFVRNPETRALEQYTGPAPGSNEPLPDIKVFVRQPWPGAAVEKIPPTTWCDEAVSYIVRNHDIRGKFDPKKAEELKVRKGKDFGRLTKGESVESEDGQTITPEMVLGPPRLGKGLAIIDLPSSEYVESLISRPEWKSPSVTTNLEAFIWLLGPGVGDHPRLREFVASMPHCKHTVSSSDYCPNYLAMGSIAGSSVRMAQLRSDNYPVPVHDNVSLPQPGTRTHGSEVTVKNVQSSPFEAIEPGLIIDMEPNFDINRSEVVPRFNAIEAVQRMPVAVQKRMSTIDKRVKKEEFEEKLRQFRKDLPGADAEIITLGTGSSSPSKYRNVSSTLVHVPGYGYYLLDCGENTLGQLKRVFEPEKLREVLQNLRMIWISHLHADHHLGTASVIKAWFQENYPNGDSQTSALETDMSKILKEKRLFLVSEENMIWWLEEYASAENFGFGKLIPLSAYPVIKNRALRTKFVYRHCRANGSFPGQEVETFSPRSTELSFDDESSPLTPLLREATGLADLLTTKVSHCRGAMALSFSGDCRPSPSFAAIGHGSTVLIHEATFQDDMGVSAIAKKHSTTSEALEVGRRMEARAILLTHFSQRYQKVAHVEKNQGPTKRQETVVQPEQPDIPDNEPEEASQAPTSNGYIPSFFSTIKVEEKPQVKVPIVAAFDYMRIRVGDMPVAQAYAPAVEKLYDILERASEEDSEKQRQQKEKQEAAKMQEKMRRKAKHDKKSKAGASLADVEPTPAKSPVKRHSAWSASEKAETRAKRNSRSPSRTMKRSS
ncbi:hypothetical protein BDV36DRAFT_282451 [Aspergillus pseudocaelatus]|uniref:ribonuclease Z n=1 Tax=Aspergillus pseudocaelatus TaxID=1825620 RepID=A0ABQ6WQ49_9EURO|nr:hypothetical protein BDV36DRAFT_282451 [Aspergillus pseudocaelatus]